MKKIIIAGMLLSAIAVMQTGCGGEKYNVDYHGQESLFKGAKATYSAGEKVKLKYDLIATDTDYSFYVDGESFSAEWDAKAYAYVLEFRMPDHDIDVYCESKNSMISEWNEVEELNENTYTSITMKEAEELFKTPGDYIIVDVRRADEFAGGHIPGAINIANETIGSECPEELPNLDQLIYVYCRSGNRSKQASSKLVEIGYTNIVEFGGILDWTGEIEQ